MRRRTYLTVLIVYALLGAALFLSGTFHSQAAAFIMPLGATEPTYRASTPGTVLVFDEGGGISVSTNGGATFADYSPTAGAVDSSALTSLSRDGMNQIILTDPTGVWITRKLPRRLERVTVAPMNENTVISCGARWGENLLVGTTFEGLWLSPDLGATWTNVSETDAFDFMYRGAGFYEQVAWCAVDTESESIVFSLDFGDGYYRFDPTDDGTPVERLETVELVDVEHLSEVADAQRVPILIGKTEIVDSPVREAARGRHGIYLSAGSAARDYLEGYLPLMRENRYDSIVVDFKDDEGRVTYNTALQKPKEIGAVVPTIDVEKLIAASHKNDLYLIARIVVFKDRRLYFADNSEYAIWDGRRGRPWGQIRRYENEETGEVQFVQGEHWVDPFSEEVWQYNIDIALELEALGVDEIQFDYIRFPSDGPTDDAVYRHGSPDADRVSALAAFLSRAREELSIPIGIDVFGFNAWFRTRYLGQDIALLSQFVDVISPMNYPSHFSRAFLPEMTYFQRSRYIYDHGSERAQWIVGSNTIIRPYVQAFLIGPELIYEEPEYSQYLIEQLDGTLDSPADGFTLWNASGRYYMVTPAVGSEITPRLPVRSSPGP